MSEKGTTSEIDSAVSLNNSFSKMLERIVVPSINEKPSPPTISEKSIEFYANIMASFGYEFSPGTLSILADYLKGYNLWLCGNVGTGKTFFFDCVSKMRRKRGCEPLVKLSMIETQGWTMEDARRWADETRDYDVVIDDVGREPKMKSYGQEAEVFPYLLEKRMQLSNQRTHLTSNYGILDIKKRYLEPVADRFVQVFKMEQTKEKKSRRVLKIWRNAKQGTGAL